MLNDFWKSLKSGSDIRGIASEGVADNENITLTNEVVEKIFIAYAFWVSQRIKSEFPSMTIAVGHDSRVSAMRLKTAAINALRRIGVNVYDCSLASTPAVFMATSVLGCCASVQITASHHPANRNGFKFFTTSGGLSDCDIEEVLELAQNVDFPPSKVQGNVREVNIMSYYCLKLQNLIKDGVIFKETPEKPLRGIKIVVDAGNGAGGFFVDNVLNPLGADTAGSVFLNPDGSFPNHMPNPENEETLKSVSDITLNAKADLGIAFDTDVDRACFSDSKGNIISKNKLIALASAIALEGHKGGVIVTDSVTSYYLKEFIEKSGGTQFRYKRGYHNVISMAKKINEQGMDSPLAVESSGHAAFKENDFTDDGAYLAAKIIIKAVNLLHEKKDLSHITSGLVDSVQHANVRIPLLGSSSEADAQKILEDLQTYASTNKLCELEKNNIEGVRIKFNLKQQKGWLILRKSIHDPVLVLYVETYVKGGIRSIFELMRSFFKKYDCIDLREFNKFC